MLHLVHPALVHFSVAFLVVGGLAEAWGLIRDRERLARYGGVAVILGTLSLVATVVSGYIAANVVDLTAEAREVFGSHERNGLILLAVFAIALFWKGWRQGTLSPAERPFYSALILVGVVLTVISALLGGRLVYVHGVGVVSGG